MNAEQEWSVHIQGSRSIISLCLLSNDINDLIDWKELATNTKALNQQQRRNPESPKLFWCMVLQSQSVMPISTALL